MFREKFICDVILVIGSRFVTLWLWHVFYGTAYSGMQHTQNCFFRSVFFRTRIGSRHNNISKLIINYCS